MDFKQIKLAGDADLMCKKNKTMKYELHYGRIKSASIRVIYFRYLKSSDANAYTFHVQIITELKFTNKSNLLEQNKQNLQINRPENRTIEK